MSSALTREYRGFEGRFRDKTGLLGVEILGAVILFVLNILTRVCEVTLTYRVLL